MPLLRSAGGVQWLLVFLGNPGPRYAHTRHNAGFAAAEALADMEQVRIDRLRFRALTAQCSLGGTRVLLMQPQTLMNLSGEAVCEAAHFYRIPPERILVVSDEVHLPPGQLRLRERGSAGGHNGLRNIIDRLGSDGFPRIRIGVGAPPRPDYDMADWVLARLTEGEQKEMEAAARRAAEACICWVCEGAQHAMNSFNRKTS